MLYCKILKCPFLWSQSLTSLFVGQGTKVILYNSEECPDLRSVLCSGDRNAQEKSRLRPFLFFLFVFCHVSVEDRVKWRSYRNSRCVWDPFHPSLRLLYYSVCGSAERRQVQNKLLFMARALAADFLDAQRIVCKIQLLSKGKYFTFLSGNSKLQKRL